MPNYQIADLVFTGINGGLFASPLVLTLREDLIRLLRRRNAGLSTAETPYPA